MDEDLRYQPIPVKDLLRELKNTSWLMVNLAFSAVMYGDRGLAEEVMELEEKVERLECLLIMQASLATRNVRDAERMVSVFKLAESSNRIANAAADIAYSVLSRFKLPGPVSPVTELGEITARLIAPSSASGKTLKALMDELGIIVDVLAVRRGAELILEPPLSFTVEKGDVLLVKGSMEAVYSLMRSFGVEPSRTKASPGLAELFEDLVKLRDISLLMLDLAYAALLMSSDDLAEYVSNLEDYVDSYVGKLELKIARRGDLEPEERVALVKLVVAIEELADGAAGIVRPILAGLEPHPIIADVLWETFERISVVEMDEEDDGKTLAELGYLRRGITVLAVKRDDDWIIAPPYSGFRVKSGDILIVKYASESEAYVEQLESEEDREEIIEDIREEELEEE